MLIAQTRDGELFPLGGMKPWSVSAGAPNLQEQFIRAPLGRQRPEAYFAHGPIGSFVKIIFLD
jgi:hypothetical protein